MLSARRVRGDLWRRILITLVLGLVAAACSASAGAPGASGAPGGAVAPGATAGAAPIGNPGQEQPGQDNGNNVGEDPHPVIPAAPADLLIIKNGTLTLQVAGIDEALTGATNQITALGGYTSGSDRSGDGDTAQASVTFRIPAARWEEALAGLRDIGLKVLTERSTSDDVTDQVVDLGARIRNLEATEVAVQGIMDRAVDIDDVLKVQAQLTSIRSEIEQLTAQRSNLESKAAFSTLTVVFSLKPTPVIVATDEFSPASEIQAASASLTSILQGLATAGIWFAIVWLPILLVIGLAIAIGIVVVRRISRATGAGRPPVAAQDAGG